MMGVTKKATWRHHYKVILDPSVSSILRCSLAFLLRTPYHNARDLFSDKINAFLILMAYILALNNDNEYFKLGDAF